MAPFGKVHSAIHSAGDRIKSGLAWANPQYQQGVGLAGKVNDLYHTGKKVANLMMPVLDRLHPNIAPQLMGGIGAMDRLRDTAVSSHDDVLAKIRENSGMVQQMRDAVAPLQPYLS